MFNSLNKLFGHGSNPTAGWPPHHKQPWVYDLRSRGINGLKLNGAFTEARPFGKCDQFVHDGEYLDLFYPASGLSLQFASDQLLSVVMAVAPGSYLVKEKKLGVGSFAIIDLKGQRHVLTAATTLQDLIPFFGNPAYSDPAGREITYSFVINGSVVETDHDTATGGLLDLEICESNDAGSNPAGSLTC